MRRFRLVTLSFLLTLGLFLSCTDGEGPVSFRAAGIVASIQIQPVIPAALQTSAAEAKPINLIRVTVTTDPGGEQIARQDFTVDPTADEWALPVEIPLSSDPNVRYVLTVELINTQGGAEEVQWSARTEPLSVSAGSSNAGVRRIQVARGPVANLAVVSLTLTGPESVQQGEAFQVVPQVEVNDSSTPTVFFTSLTPDIASVGGDGVGTALTPGTARIQAEAGPLSTFHEFEVIGVSEEILIDPEQVVLQELGQTALFTATVVDINGADRGETVTWESGDTRVVQHLGNGEFGAVGGGETFVTATGVESPNLSVSATVLVDLLPVELEVRPAGLTLTAIGQIATLEAVGIDASGNEVFGIDADFASLDPTVAEVDDNGGVTAIGTGETVIVVTSEADQAGAAAAAAGTISDEVVVTVRQEVAGLEIDPEEATVDIVGETVQFTATAFDAEGHVIPEPELSWRSDDETVATVDDTGLVTSTGRGQAEIFVESGDIATSAVFNVDIEIESLSLEPPVAHTSPGGTVQFDAVALDADGVEIDGLTFAWASSVETVATIDAVSGLATAVGVGETQISATFAGIKATARMFVQESSPTRLEFDADPTLVGSGRVIDPPVRVRAVTEDGRTAPGYSGEITVGLFSGDAQISGQDVQNLLALLDGTLTRAASNGVATFDDLVFNTTGTFQLEAMTMDDLDPAVTSPFAVVNPKADFQVEKFGTPEVVAEGGEVTFEVVITNLGPFAAANIAVAETIPGGLSGVTVTPSTGTWDGSHIWTIPAMAPGETATLTVTGTAAVPAGSTITNTANFVSSDTNDPESGNDFGTASVDVASTNVQILKSTDAVQPNVGDEVTFTVTATNTGPIEVTTVVVTDHEPAGFSGTGASASKGTVNEIEETWTIPSLAPGETATLTITGTVTGEPGAFVENVAELTAMDQVDGDVEDDAGFAGFHINTPPTVDDASEGVPQNTATVISIPIGDADGDAIVSGAVVAAPTDGSVGAVSIISNTEAQVTYTPNTDFLGADQFTLTVTDEHGAVSNVGTVDVTVTSGPANVAYETGGNTELITGTYPRPGTGHVFDVDGVLALTPGLTVTSTGSSVTTLGGMIDLQADGGFSYRPPVGIKGTDTFEYTVDTGQTATITIDVIEMIWYVNNLAGAGNGTGTSWDPFGELGMADGSPAAAPAPVSGQGPALVDGPSQSGELIFVHAGDGTTTGYDAGVTLLDGQALYGEGTGLIADGMDGAPDWGTVVAPGAFPRITNTGGNAVNLASGSEVGGLLIDNPLGHGLHASNVADIIVFETEILGGDRGILLDFVTGSADFIGMRIDGSTMGIEVLGGSPDTNYDGTISNVSGDIVSTDLQTGGRLDLVNGPFESVEGGGIFIQDFGATFEIDNARLENTSRGIVLNNVVGDVLFNGIEIVDAGGDAIDVDNLSGNGVITLQTQFVNNTGNAIDVVGVTATGTLTVDGAADIDDFGSGLSLIGVDGHVGILARVFVEHPGFGTGVYVQGGSGTVDVDDVTVVSTPGEPAPGYAAPDRRADMGGIPATAIYITSQPGTTTFNRTSIDVDGVQGIFFSGSGSGNVRFPAPGPHEVNVLNERSLFGGSTNVDATFDLLSGDGSFSDGILLSGTDGSFETLGGAIVNASAHGVRVIGSEGLTAIFGNDVTTPIGTGRSVAIELSPGSGFTFGGQVTERGFGIHLGDNGASTVDFGGGLFIDTSVGTGFRGSGGGTLTITGGPNTLNTIGHRGVDLVATPVGPAGVTFQSISVDGATDDGVFLDNPVAGGGIFTVAGTGAPGSGGTIQNNAGRGIFHGAAEPLLLNNVIIEDNALNGIQGLGAGPLTVQNSTVHLNGSGAELWEDGGGIFVRDGNLTITNSTISSNAAGGAGLFNDAGGDHLLTVGGISTMVSGNGTGFPAEGHGIFAAGPAGGAGTIDLNVSAATISGNAANGVSAKAQGTMSLRTAITTATVASNSGNGVNIGSLEGGTVLGEIDGNSIDSNGFWGVRVDQSGMGSSHFDITNNPSIDANGGGILLRGDPGSTGGLLNGQIFGNAIEGTVSEPNIFAEVDGAVPANVLIDGNTLGGLSPGGGGAITGFFAFGGGSTNNVNFLVTNNTVTVPPGVPGDALHFGVSNSAVLCANVIDNTLDAPGAGVGIFGGGFSPTHDLFIQGLPGSTTLPGPIATHWDGTNSVTGGTPEISFTPDPDAGAAPGTCSGPVPFPIIP